VKCKALLLLPLHYQVFFFLTLTAILILGFIVLQLSALPGLKIAGPMIIGIFVGLVAALIFPIKDESRPGLHFSSKYFLRWGIILLGFRLNIMDILHGGSGSTSQSSLGGIKLLSAAALVIAFILIVMHFLRKLLKVDDDIGFLVSVGTAICGAAAIMAASGLKKTDDSNYEEYEEKIGISVAIVAILGTVFATAYIFLAPFLADFLSQRQIGGLMGITLEEIAHTVAAGSALTKVGADFALLTKLSRVIMLVPTILVLDIIMNYEERKHRQKGDKAGQKSQFPMFVAGFLISSIISSTGIIPKGIITILLNISTILLAGSMLAVGMNLKIADFRKAGFKPILLGVLGFAFMFVLTPVFLYLFV